LPPYIPHFKDQTILFSSTWRGTGGPEVSSSPLIHLWAILHQVGKHHLGHFVSTKPLALQIQLNLGNRIRTSHSFILFVSPLCHYLNFTPCFFCFSSSFFFPFFLFYHHISFTFIGG
jgi:hypothetical protein